MPSIDKPVDYVYTNLMGTIQVLEAARHARVGKFVYAASSSCYGLAKTPTTEESPISPPISLRVKQIHGRTGRDALGQSL